MRCQTTKNQGMSSPIFLSSGDVIADRRFEWARDRESKGDLTGAADLLVQALQQMENLSEQDQALCTDFIGLLARRRSQDLS